jgi:hypothetical protein
MKPTMNMTTRRLSVSKGFSAGTLWRVARVVAAGALLAAGTALYFNMASGSQAGGPSSIEKMEVVPKFTDLDAVDNYLSVDDLRKYVYPEESGQARDDVASPSSYWVQRDEAEERTYDELSKNFIGIPSPDTTIKHLESQIASLLADAARDPSRNTPQLNREIERLDHAIDTIRLSAMPDTSGVRPLWNLRSIERLEEQISIIVQNAAQAGKPLSNQEIERLYAQIDLRLAAEARDRSGYSPSSSEQSGTWPRPPDTEYYLEPDYRVETQQN